MLKPPLPIAEEAMLPVFHFYDNFMQMENILKWAI